MLLLSVLVPAASAQSLDLLGECPGPLDVTVAGMTAGRSYAIVTASGSGAAVVPPGRPCAGTALGVDAAGLTVRGVFSADATGADALRPVAPAAACGLAVQALDLTTCATTPVVYVPRPVQAATISDVQGGLFASFDVVDLTGVVTAADTDGVWLQEGASAAWGGLYVYLGAGWDTTWTPLTRGDVVEVKGTYQEYFGQTEVNVADCGARSVSLLGHVAEPAPAVVGLTALVADPEPWEGVLVRVPNVTVASLPDAYGEWSVTNGVDTIAVDDRMADVSAGLAVGQALSFVQGPVAYAYGTWRILPRDASDLR